MTEIRLEVCLMIRHLLQQGSSQASSKQKALPKSSSGFVDFGLHQPVRKGEEKELQVEALTPQPLLVIKLPDMESVSSGFSNNSSTQKRQVVQTRVVSPALKGNFGMSPSPAQVEPESCGSGRCISVATALYFAAFQDCRPEAPAPLVSGRVCLGGTNCKPLLWNDCALELWDCCWSVEWPDDVGERETQYVGCWRRDI